MRISAQPDIWQVQNIRAAAVICDDRREQLRRNDLRAATVGDQVRDWLAYDVLRAPPAAALGPIAKTLRVSQQRQPSSHP